MLLLINPVERAEPGDQLFFAGGRRRAAEKRYEVAALKSR
jgi:hypothetical protein